MRLFDMQSESDSDSHAALPSFGSGDEHASQLDQETLSGREATGPSESLTEHSQSQQVGGRHILGIIS